MTGKTISHYKILAKVGEGGMGVVYKAEDTKLKRPVALKFLAPHLLEDEEARKRFHREAQAAAALHHPNVCTIHEIGEADGQTFLAMAFLEGESLDNKIEQAPLTLKVALEIARQIALGLEAAHEKGVVHRDIKPGNVMIDAKGQVTVMDFGLALLTEGSKLTKFDTTVGTVAYMSPEQARGVEVDHRTDIWALGCVLYEMTCGQRPFRGVYDQALLYEIAHEQPEPLTGVRSGVPMELEWMVDKCLAKDREERYHDAKDLILDLTNLSKKLASGRSTILKGRAGLSGGGPVASSLQSAADAERPPAASAPAAADQASGHPLVKYHVVEQLSGAGDSVVYDAEDTERKRSVSIRILPREAARKSESLERRYPLLRTSLLAACCLLIISAGVNLSSWLGSPPEVPETPLRRFALPVEGPQVRDVAISPDGRHIAYTRGAGAAARELWIWDLDRLTPRKIETASAAVRPFWSPNSDFVAFGAVQQQELKKVSVHGGPASTICSTLAGFIGGTWSQDGSSVVFSSRSEVGLRLYEVPAQGGTAKPLFEPQESEQQLDHVAPHFLPNQGGSRVLLFAKGPRSANHEIVVLDLESGRQDALTPGSRPVYSPTGHIVYESENALWALPFSAETLRATGEPFPVSGSGSVASVAHDGTLVYLHGDETGLQQLIWRDRKGQKLGTIGAPQPQINVPVLSPDGNQVVVQARENENTDVWVHEVARGLKRRLTFDPENENRPTWTPQGDKISFSSVRNGNLDVFIKPADGSGEAEPLLATPVNEWGYEWSADGKYLVGSGEGKLWYLRAEEGGNGYEKVMFLDTSFDAVGPDLSPDAKFLAYESNESGRYEVYVQPFPQGGAKWQVSTNGGTGPRWHGDGKEIFYVEGDTVMAVSVTTSPTFSPGAAQPLFQDQTALEDRGQRYDVTPEGQRFVVVETLGADDASQAIHVVQNWYEEFRDREQDYGMRYAPLG